MTIVTIGEDTGNTYHATTDEYDAALRESDPTGNYGGGTTAETTNWALGDYNVFLINFPGLSNIATDATVNSATYTMELSSGAGLSGSYVVRMYRLLRAWVEAQTTWNVYTTGNSWTTAGALSTASDRSTTLTAEVTNVTTTAASRYTWSAAQLTSDVAGMVATTYGNYGWRVSAPIGDASYHNNERAWKMAGSADGDRPVLTVDYTAAGAAFMPRQQYKKNQAVNRASRY